MELIAIFKVLLRRWWLILIPTVIVAVFSVPEIINNEPQSAGGFNTVIRYTAAQQEEALPQREGDFQDVWLASELTVNAFTDWVRTNRFAQTVAAEAATNGLEIAPNAFGIAADNERSIGQVFISWGDDAELVTLADAVITVMQTENADAFPQLGGEPAQVVILDDPQIAPVPAALPSRLRPLIQMILGVVVGVGLAFLVEYLDPTLREKDDLERLGLDVIVTVPRR